MKLYQCITADNITDIEQRIANAIALGYTPIGGIYAKQVKHNIKGEQTQYAQSLLYAPNADSAFLTDTIGKQKALLENVALNAAEPSGDNGRDYRFCEVDADIIEVINKHLNEVSE
jgi:hypothetical protein